MGESGGGRRAASRLGAEAAGRIRRAGVNSEGRPRNWGHACGSARPGNGSVIQSRGCALETRPFVRLFGSGDTVGSSGDGKSECGVKPDREGRVCPRAALRSGRVNRSFFNRQTLALHSGLTPYGPWRAPSLAIPPFPVGIDPLRPLRASGIRREEHVPNAAIPPALVRAQARKRVGGG